MNIQTLDRLRLGLAAGLATLVALLPGCGSSPLPPESTAPARPLPGPSETGTTGSSAGAAPAPQAAGPLARPPASNAPDARAYRRDAASHLYRLNSQRIYKGKLPPMLYAVGVLQIDIDRQGRVSNLHWMRAPKHAPEVVAEIERTVQRAAPYPVPTRLGKVTYTDTWLWDQGGNFQLDTLTEGQM